MQSRRSLLTVFAHCLICLVTLAQIAQGHEWWLHGDAETDASFQKVNVIESPECPGELNPASDGQQNFSLGFDGQRSLVFGPPSNAEGFDVNFTWEGFFLLSEDARLQKEPGVASRLVTQFADDVGIWTRLALGIREDARGGARLAVFLAGKTGNTSALGDQDVSRGIWHHFAITHEGTPEAAIVNWYLDYEKCGTLYLGGQENPNTLRPPGPAPFTIGGRKRDGNRVDRGFQGCIDEVRFTARVLAPQDFLKVKLPVVENSTDFHFYPVSRNQLNWETKLSDASEVISYPALALPSVPPAISPTGFPTQWRESLIVNGESFLQLQPGEYEFQLRSSVPAKLLLADEDLLEIKHSDLAVGQDLTSTKTVRVKIQTHRKTFSLKALIDGQLQRECPMVALAAFRPVDETQWKLIAANNRINFSRDSWMKYEKLTKRHLESLESERRTAARQRGDAFWKKRHRLAAEIASGWTVPPVPSDDHPVDAFCFENVSERPPVISDELFFRRLSLDLRGRIPTLAELEQFLNSTDPDRRQQAVDQFLASSEWADSWMGFWQDLLAENPSVVYPTLNNSGAFRFFIHDAFQRNLPFDRFVTELLLMDGADQDRGTAGFFIATGNDSPPAMKAHIALKAFLDLDLKCARCHDSPIDEYTQKDLFSVAAFLNDGPLRVSQDNVAAAHQLPGRREPVVTTSLKAGETLPPQWPFFESEAPEHHREMVIQPDRPRAEFAALLTSPRNPRFSDVIINRVWERYFGVPLVKYYSLDQTLPTTRQEALLRYLSQRFVKEGYDLKRLSRLILTSRVYAAVPNSGFTPEGDIFWGGMPRRISAEQLVDSLFTLSGKEFQGEVLGIGATDPGVVNLPSPRRAWEFTSLPNERDRPALGMPVNQTIVDVMAAFGWKGSRQAPREEREMTISPLQPLILFNGLMSQRIVRLSDASALTELCLEDQPPEQLIDRLFLAALSRYPTEHEQKTFSRQIAEVYHNRKTGLPKQPLPPISEFQPDWKKHLQPEQTTLMLDAQARVNRGEPPTQRLTPEFRERFEDIIWALVNSPEFVFIP